MCLWLTPRRARAPVVMAPAAVTATWVSPKPVMDVRPRPCPPSPAVGSRAGEPLGHVGPRPASGVSGFRRKRRAFFRVTTAGRHSCVRRSLRPHDRIARGKGRRSARPPPRLGRHLLGSQATARALPATSVPGHGWTAAGGRPRGGGAGGSELFSCTKRAEWLFPGNTLRMTPSLESCAVPSPTSGSSSGDRDGRTALSCRTMLGTGRERVSVFSPESQPRTQSLQVVRGRQPANCSVFWDLLLTHCRELCVIKWRQCFWEPKHTFTFRFYVYSAASEVLKYCQSCYLCVTEIWSILL